MDKLPGTSASAEKNKSNGGSKLPQMYEMQSTSAVQTDKVPLRYYTDLILSAKWIISVFVVASVGIALLVSVLTAPIYLAGTTIMVSKANLQQSPNYDTILISEDLARTYAEMITNENVLEEVRSNLNSNISSGELAEAITVNHVVDTQFIEIGVEYPDPELAVKIANGLVEVFSSQVEKAQLESATYQDDGITAQLEETQNEITHLQGSIKERSVQLHNQRLDGINLAITDLQSQIEKINEEMAPLVAKNVPTASERLELSKKETRKAELSALLLQYQDELVSLTVQGPTFDLQDFVSSQDYALLQQYQGTYRGLMDIHQNLEIARTQNMVTVTQVDQPSLPDRPVRPNLMVNLLLGAVAGLLLSTIYIFIVKLGKL